MYTPYFPQQPYVSEEEFRRQTEQRELKRRGLGIGLALVGMVFLPVFFSSVAYMIMAMLGFVDEQLFTEEFMFMQPEVYYVFYMLVYLCMVVLPFTVLIPIFRMHKTQIWPTRRSTSNGSVLLACIAGLAICMISNFLTNQWCATVEAVFGLIDSTPDMPMGESIVSKILYACIFAILPPLAEEFAFRGIVFGLLRPYGKMLAVLGSAFAFAIMHGNIVQIPFAFIGGLFFGYLVAETDSIWPAVFLHFLNNGLSVMQQFLLDALPENVASHALYISFAVITLIGIIALAVLLRRKKQLFRMREDVATMLNNRAKFTAFAVNVGMIIAYVVIGLQMMSTLQFANG